MPRNFLISVKPTDQVVHLITAAGPEECNEVFDYVNSDAGEEVVALSLPDAEVQRLEGLSLHHRIKALPAQLEKHKITFRIRTVFLFKEGAPFASP